MAIRIQAQKCDAAQDTGVLFKTKTAAKAFYRESLQQSYHLMIACQPHEAWESLLINSQNPNHEAIANLILSFQVKEFRAERRDNGFGCVAILNDGDRIPFGYNSALVASSPIGELKKFLRQVVRADIHKWKEQSYGGVSAVICCVSGLEVKKSACHVDHIDPSFNAIANEFIDTYQLIEELKFIAYSKTNIPGVSAILPDYEWISTEFRRWHSHKTKINSKASFAHLRLISASANLSRGRN